ncbi:hypothetical protein M1K46_23755 [Fictibacillus sp. WQ 8-8]|uniref:hypothetical protein n=1 Tax=Fictibacillus sp. WQ 8-8 TaxID=2938788 RepID=UPI00210B5255|nr:hypothetical protein [Fictibacillus sp. WQ 8-8]MCQ6268596.1 hypothetical protein [Fictibacillus sp. WQ 8-8]
MIKILKEDRIEQTVKSAKQLQEDGKIEVLEYGTQEGYDGLYLKTNTLNRSWLP